MEFKFGQDDGVTLDTEALRDQFRDLFNVLDAVLTERGHDVEVQQLKDKLVSLQTQSAKEIEQLKNRLWRFQQRIDGLEGELFEARRRARLRKRKSQPKRSPVSLKGTGRANRVRAKKATGRASRHTS